MTSSRRLYYKIGEACKLLDIQPYVLRYWETEFPLLAPSKSKSGQRVYSESELAIIKRIKELLYDEGFTIAGAKKRLESELASGETGRVQDAAPQATPTAQNESATRAPDSPARIESAGMSSHSETALAHLDTHAAQRIESLRKGIGEALRQARQIVDRLGPSLSHGS